MYCAGRVAFGAAPCYCTIQPADEGNAMPLRDKLMVINLLLGGIAVFLCQTMLSPAFPAIMRDFAIEATDVQWLASVYTLAMAVVVPANAYLLGRFSARQLYF